MKPKLVPQVSVWLNRHKTSDLFLTVITIGEIEFGLQCLPAGKRHQALRANFGQFIANGFDHRVIVYDKEAAHECARCADSRNCASSWFCSGHTQYQRLRSLWRKIDESP